MVYPTGSPVDSNITLVGSNVNPVDSNETVVEGGPSLGSHAEDLRISLEEGHRLLTDLHNKLKDLLAFQMQKINVFGGKGSGAPIRGFLGNLLSSGPANDGIRRATMGLLLGDEANEFFSRGESVCQQANQSAEALKTQVNDTLNNLEQFLNSDDRLLPALRRDLQDVLNRVRAEVGSEGWTTNPTIEKLRSGVTEHKSIKGILSNLALSSAQTPGSSTVVSPNTLG